MAAKQIKTKCITRVKLDDKCLLLGDPITLDKKTYDELLAAGAIQAVDNAEADEDGEETTRAQELEIYTVPVLTKTAAALGVDPIPTRKAEIIEAIIKAEEAAAKADSNE